MTVLLITLFLFAFPTNQAKPTGQKYEKSNNATKVQEQKDAKSQSNQPLPIQQNSNPPAARPSEQGQPTQHPNTPHDWVDYLNASSTGVIALFTVLLFGAVIWQTRTTRNIERAWVIVSPIERAPQMGYVVLPPAIMENADYGKDTVNVFGISIKNTGETPAHILESAALYRWVKTLQDIPIEPVYGDIIPASNLLLVKQDSVATVVRLQPDVILRKEQVIAVRQQKEFLYAYGFVKYRDVFGKPHETRFGYLYHFALGGDPRPDGFTRDGLPAAYNNAT